MQPARVIAAIWGAFAISWLLAALWRKPTEKALGGRVELPYRVVLIVGGLALFKPAHGYYGPLRFWIVSLDGAWTCAALIALGFAFCWWARIELGTLWSGNVTTKAEHRIINTGPYAIVRHPIYTGILLAVLATAAVKGTLYGIVGAATIWIGLWMKARLEETWLREQLGAEAYDAYRRRVPMLVPFGPRG